MLQFPTERKYSGDAFQIKYTTTADPAATVALHLVTDETPFTITASPSTDGLYVFDVDSNTLEMPAGAYAVSVTSTTDGKRTTLVADAFFRLRDDPTKSAGLTYNYRMVMALRALIYGAVSHENAMFVGLTHDGTQVTHIDPKSRQDLLEFYEARLEREQRALGKKSGGPTRVLWRL